MKILKNIRREFIIVGAVALGVSVLVSFVTYKMTLRQVPKFAVVDLAYLNNDFVLNLSRYLVENNAPEQEVEKMVKSYLINLDAMLGDINRSGNYVLLQKQMVVSQGVHDLTPDLEKALFESVIATKPKT